MCLARAKLTLAQSIRDYLFSWGTLLTNPASDDQKTSYGTLFSISPPHTASNPSRLSQHGARVTLTVAGHRDAYLNMPRTASRITRKHIDISIVEPRRVYHNARTLVLLMPKHSETAKSQRARIEAEAKTRGKSVSVACRRSSNHTFNTRPRSSIARCRTSRGGKRVNKNQQLSPNRSPADRQPVSQPTSHNSRRSRP